MLSDMWFENRYRKQVLAKLDEIIHLQKEQLECCKRNSIKGVKFFYKGKPMADLVLNQRQSAPVELHYVDAQGNDLGLVPASDNPSIASSDASTLQVSVSGAAGTLANVNTGTADVDDTLAGSAKGFTTSAIITCKGTGVTPPVPAGVKFVLGTPTP